MQPVMLNYTSEQRFRCGTLYLMKEFLNLSAQFGTRCKYSRPNVEGFNNVMSYICLKMFQISSLIPTTDCIESEFIGISFSVSHFNAVCHVEFCQLDVTNPSSITAFVSWIQQRFGGLDILVNNAGVSFNEIGRNSVEHAETVIKTNFYGSKTLTEALIPLFRRSGSISRILNISSQLGLQTSEIELEEKSQKLKASASCIEDLETDLIADANLRWSTRWVL